MKKRKYSYFIVLLSLITFVFHSCDSAEKEVGQGGNNVSSGNENSEETTESDEIIELVENGMEVIKEGKEIGEEVAEDIKENRERKDSIYQANRDKRWVYAIGDQVDDEDNLLRLYQKVKHIRGLAIFESSSKKYFIFQNQDASKQELMEKRSVLEEQVGSAHIKIEIVDLIADCSRKKELTQIDDVKLGKWKDKVFVPCYSCER